MLRNEIMKRLLSAFGWYEAECEICDRIIACIDQNSLEPLNKPLKMVFLTGKIDLTAQQVIEILSKKGLIDYIQVESRKRVLIEQAWKEKK